MAGRRALFARGAAACNHDAPAPLLRRRGAGGVGPGRARGARHAAHDRGGCPGAPGAVGAPAVARDFGGVGEPDLHLEVAGNLVSNPTGTAGVGNEIPSEDRKSTRLNSSHVRISYAVFCLKKKKKNKI